MDETDILDVRELTEKDIEYFINYWLDSSSEFLTGMGVDVQKKPNRQQLFDLVSTQIGNPMENRKSYFLTWLINGKPVGCSNVNQIVFGKKAFMHLHLYHSDNRQKGIGTVFVIKSLPYYFENLNLKKLYCEPYSLNQAPNKTLEKIGFKFLKQYKTIPGASNFEQLVSQWKLTRKQYEKITTP